MRPETTAMPALAVPQMMERRVCSREVYHEPVIIKNAGEMVHSNIPWSARRIMRSAQLVAKAMQSTMTPTNDCQH